MSRIWIGVMALAVAGCAPAGPDPRSPDAAVYAAALESFVPAGRSIVVVDSTIEAESWVPRAERLPGTEMVRDLVLRSREPGLVPERLPTARPFQRVRNRDLGFTGDDLNAAWLAFERRYPDAVGLYRLSGVGYDRDRTRAVLLVAHSCGDLCGTVNLVTLARVAGRWKVEDVLILVTS